MKKEPTYKEKVFIFLDKMEAGTISLNLLCTPETREKFIKTVQSYIDTGTRNGYEIVFDEKFTKIKKWDVILRTPMDKMRESTNTKQPLINSEC